MLNNYIKIWYISILKDSPCAMCLTPGHGRYLVQESVRLILNTNIIIH